MYRIRQGILKSKKYLNLFNATKQWSSSVCVSMLLTCNGPNPGGVKPSAVASLSGSQHFRQQTNATSMKGLADINPIPIHRKRGLLQYAEMFEKRPVIETKCQWRAMWPYVRHCQHFRGSRNCGVNMSSWSFFLRDLKTIYYLEKCIKNAFIPKNSCKHVLLVW